MSYFILLQGQQAGPYTEDHLRMFLSAGQVKSSDLVWCEGMAEWAPLFATLPELVTVAEPAAATARKPVPTFSKPAPELEQGATSVKTAPTKTATASSAEEETEGNPARKWLFIIGGVVLLGIVVLGSAVGWYLSICSKFDASSKAYVDDYISHVAPDWSTDDFVSRVAAPYRDQFKRDNLDHLFGALSHFGELKHYDGSNGGSHVSLHTLGKNASAQYDCHATFERGEATFSITLLWFEDHWTISGIRVDSPLFHPKKNSETDSQTPPQ